MTDDEQRERDSVRGFVYYHIVYSADHHPDVRIRSYCRGLLDSARAQEDWDGAGGPENKLENGG